MRSATVLSALVGLAASSHVENSISGASSKTGVSFGVAADFPLPTTAPDNDAPLTSPGIHSRMVGPPRKSCIDGIFCVSHANSAPILPRALAITPAAKQLVADFNTLNARAWETPCPYEIFGQTFDATCSNKKEYKTYLRDMKDMSSVYKMKSSLSVDFQAASASIVPRSAANTPAPRPVDAGTHTLHARAWETPCPIKFDGEVSDCTYTNKPTIKDSPGADLAVAVTLSDNPQTLVPGHRSSNVPSFSPAATRHRPHEQSTEVSFPTMLSVPLQVGDEWHVSVVGYKPTGNRHHESAVHPPASTVSFLQISGAEGVSTVLVQPSPTLRGHLPGKHNDVAPSFLAVPITNQGRVSTAFIALPLSKSHNGHESNHHSVSTAFVAVPTSKHHHKDHHKSEYHSSSTTLVPVVVGSHRPTPSSDHHDNHHQSKHHGTTTIPLYLPLSTQSPSCTPLPKTGNVPVPADNNPDAFVDFPVYSSISNFSAKVPGYKSVFTNRHSHIESPRHVIDKIQVPKYDALACGARCAKTTGCRGFNVFIQRDPAMMLSSSCRNPPHHASAQCWLFNQPVSKLNTSVGGNLLGSGSQRFNRVYAASNGFDKPPTYENWTGPGYVDGIYTPSGSNTLFSQGQGKLLYQQTFAEELDPAVCINACDKITAGSRGQAFMRHSFNIKNDTQHGVKGNYRPCNFFNVFQTSETGGASFTCSFWSLAPNKPTKLAPKFDGHKVESSYFYNRRYDDIGKLHQEDLIENGPHNRLRITEGCRMEEFGADRGAKA